MLVEVKHSEEIAVAKAADIVTVRQLVRAHALKIGLSLVDQTKIVTAASELARNTLDYGNGGKLVLEVLDKMGKAGLRMTFIDQGPGIPDIDTALRDGYTTGGGLGMGLGGSKRLVNEFEIESAPGQGTRVIATKWK